MRIVRTFAAALALAALLAGCLGDDAAGNDPVVNDPAVTNPSAHDDAADDDGTLPDGEHEGRLAAFDEASVTIAVVRVLSGEEAEAAAAAEGVDVAEGLPNDVYVQDAGTRVVVPLAADVDVQLVDCAAGCGLVAVSLDALIAGEVEPYGGPAPVMAYRIEGGEVVAMAEVYLP
jgi:hypothetical protein